MKETVRKSTQYLLPLEKKHHQQAYYDIYPVYTLKRGSILSSFSELVAMIPREGTIAIDGFAGVLFDEIVRDIRTCYIEAKIPLPLFINIDTALKPVEEIEKQVSGFTGGDDPLFGSRTDMDITDFFVSEKITGLREEENNDYRIIYGTGASLVDKNAFLIYIDLPRNEVQFRSRAGLKTHIASSPVNPKYDYKRNYFVDWVVQRKHIKSILPEIDIFIDGQRPGEITFIEGVYLRSAIKDMSENVFRVRPWFEPGPWGGTWIREKMRELNSDVPNYAWSFELISPENGLILENNDLMLEFSFDLLMMQDSKNVLGDCHEVYGDEFPIRFDYLDTFNGGNLSIQCHPRPEYIRKKFGENFTQEEAYYIMDAGDDALVFLGFRESIDPLEFRKELEQSYSEGLPLEIDKHILSHRSSKHDLFLIPYGTVHGSGKNNLVLEISSTPYIFTFKMYDWLRPDLDGKPRTLNISRAMENLYFDRKGDKVRDELICKPEIIAGGDDWVLENLETHPTHLYGVHRYNFTGRILIKNENKCHVLNIVEGESIILETARGQRKQFNYAETFVVPAAAGEYLLINQSKRPAMVVKAFVK
ncbi:MAG: class I mannose-6-phosphate isomerase [Bacteroidales bacterium]|nr:class I mannose-6-phosphate isomerase [Bacteroidales bacterium]